MHRARTSLAALAGAEEFEAPQEQVLPSKSVELAHHAAQPAMADDCRVRARRADVHVRGLRRQGRAVHKGLGGTGRHAALNLATS